jgi:uncharacterized protein (TIGR02246 family)
MSFSYANRFIIKPQTKKGVNMKKTLLTLTLLTAVSFSTQAWAGEKEEVQDAFKGWTNALSSGKAENVVNLYDKNAMLLATLNPTPIKDQQGRTEYFKKLTAKPKLKADVTEENIRLLDENSAVVSGLYTFSFEQDGKKVEVPARYTFVFEKEKDKWMIVEHHSSKVPEQPK